MPFKCQLAIQGGGAKLIALLAAMEAAQELQREGHIQVTRIAGTSAGAIAAALFAAESDMVAVRNRLVRTLGADVNRLFPAPTFRQLMWTTWWCERPLWNERDVRAILDPIFKEAKVYSLGDLTEKPSGIKVHLLASNLADGAKIVHSSEKDPKKSIVSALLDSCAIPYCFRVWPRGGGPTIVDGGICENLPSDELLAFEKDDGPVLALSFRPVWPGPPQDFLAFTMALLDTAMNNSVDRAKARLGADRLHLIDTNLTTFDFGAASTFSNLDGDPIRKAATEFFRAFVEKEEKSQASRSLPGDPWSELNLETMEGAWRIYTAQHAQRLVSYEHCSLIVQANCLESDGHESAHADFVTYSGRFRTREEFFCTMLSIIPTEGTVVSLANSEIYVSAANGQSIDYVLMPARDPSAVAKRPALLFFTPPLPADSGPYTLELKQRVPGFMKRLLEGRRDDLFIDTKATSGNIETIDLVLQVPKAFKEARLLPDSARPAGREMTQHERVQYSAPPGFRTLGWRAEGFEAGERFRVEVIL
jgi:predicted acylesterase/phospholipase RssA